MKKKSCRGDVKSIPSFSEILMTTPMFLILLLFSALPFIISLFSVEKMIFSEIVDIFRDSSTRITLEVSFLYAIVSIIFSINISMRLAYRMYFSGKFLKNGLLAILFLTWIIPSFIAIPLYRSVIYWFTDTLIATQLSSFLITASAKVWINLPLITLIAFASISQTSKNHIEMMMTEGASKEIIYEHLFKPATKNILGTFSLLLFINSLRDLNIPLMMTNGRPYIGEGFTSYGIAGSTTTFGLFLKDSLLRLNTDFVTVTQSLFATIIILTVFICVLQLKKGKYQTIVFCTFIDLFFYTGILTVITVISFFALHYLTAHLRIPTFKRIIILTIPVVLNSLILIDITPGLLIAFTFLLFYSGREGSRSNSIRKWHENLKTVWHIIGDFSTLIWLFISGAVFFNLTKLMFSNPLYIPEWNEFEPFTLRNFIRLFNNGFTLNIFNSILLGLLSAFIIVLIVLPAGYTTTIRKRFNRSTNFLILFSLAITGMNTIIPLFIMFRGFHMTDTYVSVILTIVNHSIPMAFLIVTEDMKKISPSYLDTARLEGASHLQIFLKIIFPLIIPIASVISLKVIVDGFSSFTAPLMFISSPEKFPIALRLFAFAGKDTLMYPEWGLFAAGSAISIGILFLLIYPFRRFLMKGIYRSWSDE